MVVTIQIARQYSLFSFLTMLTLFTIFTLLTLLAWLFYTRSELLSITVRRNVNTMHQKELCIKRMWGLALWSNVLFISPWAEIIQIQVLIRDIRHTSKLQRQVLGRNLLEQLFLV